MLTLAAHLGFGRDVTLQDGTKDRTKTTLALLSDPHVHRLSFFLCQQPRPELIYVPEWLAHPATGNGICGVTIVSDSRFYPALQARFSGVHGGCKTINGGPEYQTANGMLRVMTAEGFEQTIGHLSDMRDEALSFIAGMDLTVADPNVPRKSMSGSGLSFRGVAGGIALSAHFLTANTLLPFFTA